jgi:hypothetical protein
MLGEIHFSTYDCILTSRACKHRTGPYVYYFKIVEEGRLLERKSRHQLSSHPSMTLSRLGYNRHRRRSSCPPRTRQSQAAARDRSRLGAAAIAGVAPPQHHARPARYSTNIRYTKFNNY